MPGRTVSRIMALSCFFLAQSANAFFDPPWITPVDLFAGDTVSVNIRAGVCDGILEMDGYPQVTRYGNAIRILFFGSHVTNTDFCNYPSGTAVVGVAAYSAGSYTLQVDVDYISFTGDPRTLNLGAVPFTVLGSAGQPVPAPAIGGPSMLVLIVGLSGVALRGFRSRKLFLHRNPF
jgi:hypothetical protein